MLWLVSAAATGLVPKAYGHWFALLRWAPPVVLLLVCAAHGVVIAGGADATRRGRARAALGLACLVVGGGAVQAARLATEGHLSAWRVNLATLRVAPGAQWIQVCTKLVPRLVAADTLGEEPARVASFVAAARDIGGTYRVALELLTAIAAGYGAATNESFEVPRDTLERSLPADASLPERRALALGLGQRLCADLGAADGWSALGALGATGVAGDELDVRAEALGRYGSGWVLFPALLSVELEAIRGAPGAAAASARGPTTRWCWPPSVASASTASCCTPSAFTRGSRTLSPSSRRTMSAPGSTSRC